jgi:MFS family permease
MAMFSSAFGAMLLSIVLWDQTVWGWTALKIGTAIAPGPLLVPTVSLLFSKRLIARFGASSVVAAGIVSFSLGLTCWATALGIESNFLPAVLGMMLIGIGVGLTLPTLMGVGMAALPPSSFATGSGVINMIRQAGLAIGVAVLVAIIGSPDDLTSRIEAFRRGWWVMVAIVLLSLIPTWALIRTPLAKTNATA